MPTAGVDAGPLVGAGDAGLVVQPQTTTCGGAPDCISGKAVIDPLFSARCPSAACPSWQVALFRVYPVGAEQPVATELVAMDGTWAFSGVDADAGSPWSHYYVQAAAVFASDAGQNVVSTVVGPLTAPDLDVDITLRPIQATAYESRLTGGSTGLDWVLARLFDPATGSEITSGAQVAVTVGGSATPLAFTSLGPSGQAYYASFAQPPAAQPSYAVTASHPAFGDAGLSLRLVADPPSFDGTITSPDGGSTDGGVASPLTVTWTAQPQADYEVVELYAAQDGGWASAPAFVSPRPNPPDRTSESTGALDAGTYLVNVGYTKASCPADAGACVQAAAVAATTVTVH